MMEKSQLELDFTAKEEKPAEKRVVVFDLETQLDAGEVGGWNNAHLMRVSVGVAHDSLDGKYKVYYDKDVPELISLLKSADLVVGFNSRRFDYAVLGGYTDEPLGKTLPTLDILEKVEKTLGFRVSLDNIATATLGVSKTATGIQALKWFKEGKLDLIAEYCTQDVRITRDVFIYGLQNSHLYYSTKTGQKTKFSVNFSSP